MAGLVNVEQGFEKVTLEEISTLRDRDDASHIAGRPPLIETRERSGVSTLAVFTEIPHLWRIGKRFTWNPFSPSAQSPLEFDPEKRYQTPGQMLEDILSNASDSEDEKSEGSGSHEKTSA